MDISTAPLTLISAFGALAAGAGTGIFYFGGLWATVRRFSGSSRPYLALALSFAGRTAVAMTIFYILLKSGWASFALAILTFFLTRFVMVRALGSPRRQRTEEAS